MDPLLLVRAVFPPNVTFLRDGELGTLALGKGDPCLVALADNENVGYPIVQDVIKM